MNKSSEHIRLISRFLSGNASGSEKAILEQWLSMSAENQNEFLSYQHIWDIAGRAESKANFNTDESWNKLNTMISCIEVAQDEMPVQLRKSKKATLSIGFYLKRIAAIFVLAFGVYYLFNSRVQPEMLSVDSNGLADCSTQLPDGTHVFLNQSSSISYPEEFRNNQRLVAFEGEAFFQVAHNPEKPMIIETDNLRVKVLGTSFDLINYPDCDKVILYLQEGKVLFYSVDSTDESVVEQIVLVPGQKGVYNKVTHEITKEVFENNNFMAWQSGILEFDKTPLEDVFRVLKKTYGIEISSSEACEGLLLTARYQDETIDSIFESLHVIFGIEYTIDDKQIILL